MVRGTIVLPREADAFDEAALEIKETMAQRFGGYTITEGNGGWVSPDNELIEEPVVVFETFTDDGKPLTLELSTVAAVVKGLTGEESVMYTIDNEARFA